MGVLRVTESGRRLYRSLVNNTWESDDGQRRNRRLSPDSIDALTLLKLAGC